MKTSSKHKTTKSNHVFFREKETRSLTARNDTLENPNIRAPQLARSQSITGRQRSIDEEKVKKLKLTDFASQHTDDQIELAVSILQKEPEDRDTLDIKILMHFTENVDFFKEYDQDTRKQCMREMYHVYLHKDDYCMRQGEYGDTFWVTLKGTVGIKVKTERETEKNGEKVKEKFDLEVASRGAGYAFGHLALLERKPRAATIYCKEDCEFAVLNKIPFQRILSEKEEQRLFAEVNFLKAIKMFSQWSYASIKAFFLLCLPKNYLRGHIVYNQRDKSEHMYIVRSGDFKVSFEASYREADNNNQLSNDTEKIKRKFVRLQPTRPVELAIIGPLEIFGFEEMMAGEPRMHMISCVSQAGTVLEVKRKDVEATILADSGAAQWLRYYFSSKAKIHDSFIRNMYNTTMPFKEYLLRNKTASSKRSNISPAHERPNEINQQIFLNSDRSPLYDIKFKSDNTSKETLEAQNDGSPLTERIAHNSRAVSNQSWKKAFRAKLNSNDPKSSENQIFNVDSLGSMMRINISDRGSLDQFEKFHSQRRNSLISALKQQYSGQSYHINSPAGIQTAREYKNSEKNADNFIAIVDNVKSELSPITKLNQKQQDELTTKMKVKELKLNNLYLDAQNIEVNANIAALISTNREADPKNQPDFGMNVDLFDMSSSRKKREQRKREYDKAADRKTKSDIPNTRGQVPEFTYEKAVLRKFVNDAMQLGYEMLKDTDKMNPIDPFNNANNPLLYNKTISNLRDAITQRAKEQRPRTPVNIHVIKLKQEGHSRGISRGMSRERSLTCRENRSKGTIHSDLSPIRQHFSIRSNHSSNPLMLERYENLSTPMSNNISKQDKNKIATSVKRVASRSLQHQQSPIHLSKPEIRPRDTITDIIQRVTNEVPSPLIKKQEIILPKENLRFNWLLNYPTPSSEVYPISNNYLKQQSFAQKIDNFKHKTLINIKRHDH